MIRFVLDTDHITLHQKGHLSIQTHLLSIHQDQIAVTVISFGEQIQGWLAQARRAQNISREVWAYHRMQETLEYFAHLTILGFDEKAAGQFQHLRQRRIRIGTQDLRIAAIALSNACILVTRNRRDFERIPGLAIEDWSQGG